MLWMMPFLFLLGACGSHEAASELSASKEARYLLQTPTDLPDSFWATIHTETLTQDFLEQRKLGWNFWTALQKPVGRFAVWQTWYSREDLQRIFRHLYESLGASGRRQRLSFSEAAIDGALVWNDREQFHDATWDRVRFEQWLATYDSDEKMQAVPGMQKILFNRQALVFMLRNYRILENCQKQKLAQKNCEPLNWPHQVVFVKTSWRRSEGGYRVENFRTDAEALATHWQKPTWIAETSYEPAAQASFSLRLPTGQKFHLTGMHASLRLQNQWFWTSIWLDPEAAGDQSSDQPEHSPLPWRNYRQCSLYGWSRPLATQTITDAWPSGVAALASLQKKQGAENWCSNPYLEVGINNHKTNCIGCHQHAGRNWKQQEFTRRLVTDLSSLVQPAPDSGPADFVWSLFAGPEALILPIMESIEYFDVYDPYQ